MIFQPPEPVKHAAQFASINSVDARNPLPTRAIARFAEKNRLQKHGCRGRRHLIPDPAFEFAPGLLLSCSPPLLKEKGDACVEALVADFQHPRRVHGAGAGAGFAEQIRT